MTDRFQTLRRFVLAALLGGATLGLAACEPDSTRVSGSVGVGVYYDSMLWNDYYYGGVRPPYRPPPPPPGTRPPIEPPGGVRPPINRPPSARPPTARPPIHRPAGRPGRAR